MNENKVLVRLIVPEIDESYDMLLPINKKIGNIIELINKMLNEITNGLYVGTKQQCLYSRYGLTRYNNNILLIETDIRNGSEIVLM